MFPLLEHIVSVGSTNDALSARVRSGCPHGSAIYADEQTAGRGRRGRSWSAAPGMDLMLSVAIIGPRHQASMLLVPMVAGVGAAEAIARRCGVEVGLKWPNDLMVDGRKVGGILCEAVLEGPRFVGAVVGIGVNVNSTPEGQDPDLRRAATSLRAHTHDLHDLHDLAASVRLAIVDAADRLAAGDAPALLDAWRARDVTCGRRVVGEGFVGTALGITDDGALRIQTDADTELIVRSGEVRFETPDDPS